MSVGHHCQSDAILSEVLTCGSLKKWANECFHSYLKIVLLGVF